MPGGQSCKGQLGAQPHGERCCAGPRAGLAGPQLVTDGSSPSDPSGREAVPSLGVTPCPGHQAWREGLPEGPREAPGVLIL